MNNRSILLMIGGIVTVAIAFVIFPIILDASHDIRVDDATDQFVNITTGVAETTANVTLTYPLYEDNSYWVGTITSTEVTDVPAAGTYVAATQNLTVTGLAASKTRTLTVPYSADALTNYSGVSPMVTVAPLIIFVGILFGGGSLFYFGIRRK